MPRRRRSRANQHAARPPRTNLYSGAASLCARQEGWLAGPATVFSRLVLACFGASSGLAVSDYLAGFRAKGGDGGSGNKARTPEAASCYGRCRHARHHPREKTENEYVVEYGATSSACSHTNGRKQLPRHWHAIPSRKTPSVPCVGLSHCLSHSLRQYHYFLRSAFQGGEGMPAQGDVAVLCWE